MSSWNAAANSCPNISALLDNSDCTLVQLLCEENIKIALKRQIPRLIDFLIDHIEELAEIALGASHTDYPKAQEAGFHMILTQIHSLTSKLIENKTLLSVMNRFIDTNGRPLTPKGAAAFARILQFLIQASSCKVLDIFPERELLFERILQHLPHVVIVYLLDFITDNGSKPVVAFLEDNKATDLLLAQLSDDETKNEQIFIYLTNIISTIEIDSPLLSPFEDVNIMNQIFNRIMTTTNSHVASRALNFLFELTGQCDSEEEDPNNVDPLYDSVFKFVVQKMPEICNYISSPNPFLSDKSNATELITILLASSIEMKQCVLDLAERLFDQIFLFPCHTILHRSFLALFNSVLVKDRSVCANLVKKMNMRQRIIDAFEKRYQSTASYWGMLYTLTIKLNENLAIEADYGNANNNDANNWEYFVQTVINPLKEIILGEYGGILPDENEQDSDSEEIDFPLGKSQLAKQAAMTKMPQKGKTLSTAEEEDFGEEEDEK